MNICRQCFREKSQDIGFHKVRDMACAIENHTTHNPATTTKEKISWKKKKRNMLSWGVQVEKERTLSLTHMFYQTTVPLNQISTGNSWSRNSLRPRRSVTILGNSGKDTDSIRLGFRRGNRYGIIKVVGGKSCTDAGVDNYLRGVMSNPFFFSPNSYMN